MKWFLLDCLLLLCMALFGGCTQSAFDQIDLDPSLFDTPAAAAVVSPGVPGSGQGSASAAAPPASAARPWLTDYARGWQLAAFQERPMLVVLHRQSCAPCKELLYSTFRNARIRERLAASYVLTVLDTEKTDPRIISGLSDGRLVLPTMVMVDHGYIIARHSGSLLPAGFEQWLDSTPTQQPHAQSQQGVEAKPTALPVVQALACATCASAHYAASVGAVGHRLPRRAAGAVLHSLRGIVSVLPVVRRFH